MMFQQLAADRQTKPGPLGLGGMERNKNLFQLLIRNPRPGINHPDPDVTLVISLMKIGLDDQGTALLHGLDSVENNIKQDLLNLFFVNPDRRQTPGQFLDAMDVLCLRMLRDKEQRCLDQAVDIDEIEFRFARPAEVEQVVDRLVEPLDLFEHLFDNLLARVVFDKIVRQDRNGAADAGQRIFHLVGNAGRHLPDRSQPVGPLHLLVMVLFQLPSRLAEVFDHRVEAPHQHPYFVVVAGIHADRQVTLLNLCHLLDHVPDRALDETDENKRDPEREKQDDDNGRNKEKT